jgi:hypothetical protein
MTEKSEFYLRNYLAKENIEFNYESQIIKIDFQKDKFEKHNEFNNSDYTILSINKLQKKEDSLNLAIDLKNLLSFALGKRIIFNKQSYFLDEKETVINKEMVESSNSGPQIIPDLEIKDFLLNSLPIWRKLSNSEKNNFYTIFDYLNQTREGFIEDRILRTLQAWECSANYWTDEVELSDDFKDLKKRISETFKHWKKETGYIDTNGALGSSYKSVLEQEKLMLRLENFISENKLNKECFNLDLKKMKNMRDSVVHQGKIDITGNSAIEILEPCIKSLQLIILKKLNYNGLIIDSKNNWRTDNNINNYFK